VSIIINIIGVILCLTCINLLDVTNRPAEEVMRLRVELILVISMTLWIVISFITLLAFPTSLSNEGLIIIGSFADTSSFIYYCAPLSFAVEVIMTKNSKRFYVPTILLNLLTTILWFLYGLVGVNEITVWLPNIIGSSVCLLQIVLALMYPAFEVKDQDDKEMDSGIQVAGKYGENNSENSEKSEKSQRDKYIRARENPLNLSNRQRNATLTSSSGKKGQTMFSIPEALSNPDLQGINRRLYISLCICLLSLPMPYWMGLSAFFVLDRFCNTFRCNLFK
jgi:hypothetical protein